MHDFIKQLASGDPVPGGGGASALLGSVGVALCSMVAHLTSGKKTYAVYQADIETVLRRTDESMKRLLVLIEQDAAVFAPLSQAYRIPKDDPNRAEILEAALAAACSVPLEILEEIEHIIDILHILAEKGSRLALSDVGVAATALRAAAEGAALNVLINTKLMQDRQLAQSTNEKTETILARVVPVCDEIYAQVKESLVIV